MKTDRFSKEDVLTALKVKLGTELFYAAIGESYCEDLMSFIRRSPKEEFTRKETNFLVNHALSEVWFHGTREDRVKLARILQVTCWADISRKEIGLEGGLPSNIF